jgi:hypothetical protein
VLVAPACQEQLPQHMRSSNEVCMLQFAQHMQLFVATLSSSAASASAASAAAVGVLHTNLMLTGSLASCRQPPGTSPVWSK